MPASACGGLAMLALGSPRQVRAVAGRRLGAFGYHILSRERSHLAVSSTDFVYQGQGPHGGPGTVGAPAVGGFAGRPVLTVTDV